MSWEASWVATRAAAALVGALGRLEDVEDVDVGDVVELVAAALAERDDRQPCGLGAGHPRPRDRQRRLEGAGREVGQLGRGVVDTEMVGEVAGGEPDQDAAVLHAQDVGRLRRGERRRRVRALRVGADRPRSAPRTAYAGGPGGAEERVGQLAPLLGMPAQVVGQRLARAEDREQPHRGALVVGELGHELRPGPLGQAGQLGERLVRVGRAGQDRDQRVGPVAQRGQLGAGPRRVLEPEAQQPRVDRVAAAVGHRVNVASRGRAPRRSSAPDRRPAPTTHPVAPLADAEPFVQGIRKLSYLTMGPHGKSDRPGGGRGMRGSRRDPGLRAGSVPDRRRGRARVTRGAVPGQIRVNQQGYLPQETKQAMLMAPRAVHHGTFVVTDRAGHVVLHGRVPVHVDRVVEQPVPRRLPARPEPAAPPRPLPGRR